MSFLKLSLYYVTENLKVLKSIEAKEAYRSITCHSTSGHRVFLKSNPEVICMNYFFVSFGLRMFYGVCDFRSYTVAQKFSHLC